jgi:hypothetical protein
MAGNETNIEEKKDVNSASNQEQVAEEKQSNKTFTQSELDSMMSREKKKLESQYADYNEMKTKLDELVKEKEDKELAEKSEVEKKQVEIEKLTQKVNELSSEYETQKRLNLRNDVLSDTKYSKLTRAYKNLVKLSDDKDEIIANADEILEEFEKDFSKKESYGTPLEKGKSNGGINTHPNNLAEHLKAKIAERMKLG